MQHREVVDGGWDEMVKLQVRNNREGKEVYLHGLPSSVPWRCSWLPWHLYHAKIKVAGRIMPCKA